MQRFLNALASGYISRARLYEVIRWSGLLQDSVVYGAEFGVVFLVEGPSTASMQEGLDCLGFYHSGLEGERYFRLVVELTELPPDVMVAVDQGFSFGSFYFTNANKPVI